VSAPGNLDRYHRQTILPAFGPDGAARLAAAHAMIVGCGALGCPAADLLARAGVGRITLIDRDVVEWTNLQRQTLFSEADARARLPKAEAAAARLRAVNASILIEAIADDLSGDAPRLLASHPAPGVVLDCTDNFETRYLLNDACVQARIPLVYGGAVGTSGMNMVVLPGTGPCLRCVFPDPPPPGSAPTCDTAGVLGPVAAMVGARQAADALRVLVLGAAGIGASLTSADPWNDRVQRIDLSRARRADCPCCGLGRFEFLDRARDAERCVPGRRGQDAASALAGAMVLCGRDAVQITPGATGELDLAALAGRLASAGSVELMPSHLRGTLRVDGREHPITVFPDGRAIVGGTADPTVAKGLYARFVG